MITKRIMRCVIVLFLLAALPVMTAVMAQEQEPAVEQLPVVTEPGESVVAFPWENTESEPNNIPSAADDWCRWDCRRINGGIISTANDVDYWELYVPALYGTYDHDYYESREVTRDNYPILIDIEAQSIGSSLNATICLYSDDGYELACSNDTDTPDPMLYYNFEVTNSDTPRHYYLAVRAHNGVGTGADGRYQLLVSTPYLFSAAAEGLGTGNVEGIPFQAGDILAFSKYGFNDQPPEHKWVMLLDLSDLGVKGNITSLSSGWRNSDFLLVGFAANATLPGIGRTVTPWEVVIFNPTQVGPSTQGTFEFFWDGRTQGLTTAAEKLDAIDWPEWNGVTRLYASTVGNAKVYGGPGPVLTLPDEDIGLWSDGPAAQNYPRWSRLFDTSVANAGIADVIAYSYTEYRYYFEEGLYKQLADLGWDMVVQRPGFSQKDVISSHYSCFWIGSSPVGERDCSWSSEIKWRGPDYGWNYNLDAIQVQRTVRGMQ